MLNEHSLYLDNKYLNKAEYHLGRLYLYSMPRYATIVLGNGCNIDCRHCYQFKNGDNLLRDPQIGIDLRRELTAFYPYLSTLRIQGGEVFALRGFEQLLDDIKAFVKRPIVSISTNGTLIDERWARRLVDLPLQSMTVSLDGTTSATYEKIRRGADFHKVLENIRRIQTLKQVNRSTFPVLDVFFVIMRSNFREIPLLLNLLIELGINQVSFQTMLVDQRNLDREPALANEETIREPVEVRELYDILKKVAITQAPWFQRIAWSGLHSLFCEHGLNADFLQEQTCTLTPDQNTAAPGAMEEINSHAHLMPPDIHPELGEFPEVNVIAGSRIPDTCPNPWSTLFITENGDVSLCFLSDPVGNLYQTPLIQLWNGSAAIAKRSNMLNGKYLQSGCSELWCNWREGSHNLAPTTESWRQLLKLSATIVNRISSQQIQPAQDAFRNEAQTKGLQAVRRLLQAQNSRIKELETQIADLWDKNGVLHDAGQQHIEHLEEKVKALEELLKSPDA